MIRRGMLVALAVMMSGCPGWPSIPSGCRNFAGTTWRESLAPWNEVEWSAIYALDEPLLPAWHPESDLNDPVKTCAGLAAVRARLAGQRAAGKRTWINWSWEEFTAVTRFCGADSLGAGADIVSFDSYGGVWDWDVKTRPMLAFLHRHLEPGQMMALVPEAHFCPDCGVDWSEEDYKKIASLYFDWAMRNDDTGRIFAIAPFLWSNQSPSFIGLEGQPWLSAHYQALFDAHPRCNP